MYYTTFQSPMGEVMIAGDEQGLSHIAFQEGAKPVDIDWGWQRRDDLFSEAVRQLSAYFQGHLQDFNLPLAPTGTPFQKSVWMELQKIPFGQSISYGELAKRVGNPKASRAVGAANGKNPLSVVIPCHRVIGSNGSLTGYAGGLAIKEKLLNLEKAAS